MEAFLLELYRFAVRSSGRDLTQVRRPKPAPKPKRSKPAPPPEPVVEEPVEVPEDPTDG